MRVAIEGCAHGELEKIYETIEGIQEQENCKIDLLICCGDFQATRNLDDLQTMSVPKKYLDICTFYKYYSGEKIAPVLTIFIGGNHEASNYLQELPYGGWVAPKIYYLGYASVININGIRIAGLSGIYKGHDYNRGRYEFSPYSESTKKSVYHIRQLDVFRLKQLTGNIDIFLSHDWPRGVYNYGNLKELLKFKPHFRDEIDCNKLGSPPCEDLMKILKPSFWFSAHMHCKFAAIVPHDNSNKVTRFLALDKCLPKRKFLQILEIDSDCGSGEVDGGQIKLEYDLEWLTILFLTNHLISSKNTPCYMPGPNSAERYNFIPTDEEKELIRKKFCYDLKIPDNFTKTVEPYSHDNNKMSGQQPKSQINPQTTLFCDTLGIDDPLTIAMVMNGHELSHSSILDESTTTTSTESSFLTDGGEQSSFNSTFEQASPVKRKSLMSLLPNPKYNNSSFENIDGVGDNPEEMCIQEDQEEEFNFIDTTTTTSCSMNQTVSSDITDLESFIEETINESENTENSVRPMKKFKRRNQNLYSNNSEEQ